MTSQQVALLLLLSYLSFAGPLPADAASRLKLNSQFRYEDLLISADEAYLSSPEAVERLKAFLSALSAYLAEATEAVGRRLSLGQVRLLVPRNRVQLLRQAGYSLTPASWESANRADIVVNSGIGGQGSVLHSGMCGDSGLRINMPDYLMRPGNAGYILLARLFAQYRWGVLPETSPDGQKFYLHAESFRPLMCSDAIPGRFQLTPGGPLSSDIGICIKEDDGRLDVAPTCTFIADSTSSTAYASLMSDYATHAHVKRFCDSVGDPALRHSRYARTVHAKMCGQRSTAEVARQHPDFAEGSGTSSADTVPQLVLVEPPTSRKIVLMLDVSGSMVLEYRIQNLITAATRYVNYFVEPGAEVSIASFNESVQLLQPLRPLNGLADRELLSNSIRGLVAAGWTNIADAIMVSMKMLAASPPYNASQTGWVVLITDGEHNNGNLTVAQAIGNASLTSIVFDTICISDQSDKRLTELSNRTGGWSMFSSSSETNPVTTELDSAFAKLADRTMGPNRTVLLSASTFTLPMEPISLKVDDSVTSSLNFMLSIPGVNVNTLNVTARDPNGRIYGSFLGSGYYEVNQALGSVVIKIPDPNIVVGTWTVSVTSANAAAGRRKRDVAGAFSKKKYSSSSKIGGSIVLIGATGRDSVSMTAWLRYNKISEVTAATLQLMYARVVNSTGNETGLVGASVQARVVSPYGSALTVAMKDDGLGFDVQAGDNIYTGALTADQLTSVGDHSVTVNLLTPVYRVTSAGKFLVSRLPDRGTNGSAPSLRPPPGKIVDLKVDMMIQKRLLRVTFTAPGDKAYTGTAASYELRASMQPADLLSAFSSAPLIARAAGLPAGSPVQLSLGRDLFPAEFGNLTFHLSAAALSTNSLTGEPSLPMGAMFDYPINFRTSPTDTPTTATTAAATQAPQQQGSSSAGTVARVRAVLTLLCLVRYFV